MFGREKNSLRIRNNNKRKKKSRKTSKESLSVKLIMKRNKLGIISRKLNKFNYPGRSSQRKTRVLRQCLSPSYKTLPIHHYFIWNQQKSFPRLGLAIN